MNKSPKYNSDRQEKGEVAVLLDKLKSSLIDILGQGEADEHIEFLQGFDDTGEVIGYLYGMLLNHGIDPEDFLIATNVLEPGTETE